MSLYTFAPGKENFILCMSVKTAEAADRNSEYDEIYTGYLDGTILFNKITGDSVITSKEIWKGNSNIILDESPVSDIKFDFRGKLWFSLSNKEIYYLEDRIAEKVCTGAEGRI